ncbi:MAG: PEP-CTERM sorting domain-containing protein [Pirellulales bacterium]
MRRFRSSFSALTLLVSCLAPLCCGPRSASADPAVYEIGDDPGVGFNLIAWFNFDNAATPAVDEGIDEWQGAVQAMFNAGFREVSISPVRYFNTTTFAIAPTSTQGPLLTSIEAGVVRAKELGMRVTLNPFVEPQAFANWRGTYNPQGAAADTFWADYQNYLVGVAQIAETHGVEAFTVGTEYNAIDQDPGNNGRWDTVINAVDAVYHGQIGYAANHDHYDHANVTTALWEHPAIDFLGIDSYFTDIITDYATSVGATSTQRNAAMDNNTGLPQVPGQTFVELMTAAWNLKLGNEILPFAAARKGGAGMPVVFTEIGYLPYNRTIRNPQNSSGEAVDTAEQIAAFNGLINALDGRADVFEAMHIWQWHMPGSDGSLWNIDPTLPANQPNNVPLGQWLANFVNTDVLPLAGDYNRDGVVDAGDYTTWRDSLGSFVANFNAADGDGDGIVDDGDYEVWKSNFGGAPGGGGSLAQVPEPGTAGLILAGLGAVSLARGSRRHPGGRRRQD